MEALTGTINHVKTELMPNVDFTQFDHVQEREEAEPAPAGQPTQVDSELKWD
jgi:hypothetical protein